MKWSIESMNIVPDYQGMKDMVISVNWKINHKEQIGECEAHYSFSAMTELQPNDGESFTEYSSLTEDQVIEFVKHAIGEQSVQNFEDFVLNMTLNMQNMMLPSKPLPWK